MKLTGTYFVRGYISGTSDSGWAGQINHNGKNYSYVRSRGFSGIEIMAVIKATAGDQIILYALAGENESVNVLSSDMRLTYIPF